MADPNENIEPKLYVWFPVGNTGAGTDPGAIGWNLKQKGWKKVVADSLVPEIEWAKQADPDCGVVTHYAFGHWRRYSAIDDYEGAVAADCDWITHEFSAAWKPICKERRVLGYTGNVSLHPRLVDLPNLELGKVIQRNLKPYLDAGFHGIAIDATFDALTCDPAFIPGQNEPLRRSTDAIALARADAMFGPTKARPFGRLTGIEASPRRFPLWNELAKRDVWMGEPNWRNRHDPASPNFEAQTKSGWGERSYIKGRVHRLFVPGDWKKPDGSYDTPAMLAACQRCAQEGDVVAINPITFIQAGVKASEIFK